MVYNIFYYEYCHIYFENQTRLYEKHDYELSYPIIQKQIGVLLKHVVVQT